MTRSFELNPPPLTRGSTRVHEGGGRSGFHGPHLLRRLFIGLRNRISNWMHSNTRESLSELRYRLEPASIDFSLSAAGFLS